MADYLLCGQKGAGKTLLMVSRLRSGLLRGEQVATNLNLNLIHMLPKSCKDVLVYRIPDLPSGDELFGLGKGSDSKNESTFGHLCIDESAVMLNARDWNEGGRTKQSLLRFVPQSRKQHWHTYFITQLQSSMDKQIRGLGEQVVNVFRTDRVPIPIIGGAIRMLMGILGFREGGLLPQYHVGLVFYRGNLTGKWFAATSSLLHASYDTDQIFSHDYPYGLYCYLPPWYFVDRTGEWVGEHYVSSLELYHSSAGVLYGWPGRPKSWDNELPLVPDYVVSPVQKLLGALNHVTILLTPRFILHR